MLDFLKKIEPFLLYSFLGILIALSSLHLFIGYADNGDFTRSVGFIFEKPYGFSAMWPLAGTEEFNRRFQSEWHDKWVFLNSWPDEKHLFSYSSYKLYLLLQIKLSALFLEDARYYSIIAGSLISRIIFLSAFFALFRNVRKTVPVPTFWIFVVLASMVFMAASWTAFLNSFYEDQVAIIFLPVVAFLLYKYNQQHSLKIGFSVLIFATIIGSSKTAFFYFPILATPFVFPIHRGKHAAIMFALAVAICQSITFLPVYFGQYQKVNQYHAVYYGALKCAQQIDEAKNIEAIGNKPVVQECIGVPFFSPAGEACMQKANANYGDVARLIYKYPKVGFKMIAQALSEGSHIDVPILEKKLPGAPDFSNIPIFNLESIIFSHSLNLLVLTITALVFPVLFLASTNNLLVCGAMLKIGLFFSIFGFCQYVTVLGDGFFEITKHLMVGNFSLALSATFLLPGLLLLTATYFQRKRII